MEVSSHSYSSLQLVAKCNTDLIFRSCKYKEQCSNSSNSRLRPLEAKVSTPCPSTSCIAGLMLPYRAWKWLILSNEPEGSEGVSEQHAFDRPDAFSIIDARMSFAEAACDIVLMREFGDCP